MTESPAATAIHVPTFEDLWDLFPGEGPGRPPRSREIPEEDLPGSFRKLLAHRGHMTETLEERWGGPASIEVLSSRIEDNLYLRRTLLFVGARPALLGVVRLDLDRIPPAARGDVLRERIPLGRILMERGLFRGVDPLAYLEVRPNEDLRELLGAGPRSVLHGRLARILGGEEPVVDLLEILAPAEAPLC
jgi:chorismate-pyruvate lyase